MKHKLFIHLPVLVLSVAFLASTAWSEGIGNAWGDQSSRIAHLEEAIVDLQGQIDALPGPQNSGYLSISFLAGVDAWPSTATGKVANIWYDVDQFANADTSHYWQGRSAYYTAPFVEKQPVYLAVQLPDEAVVTDFGLLYYDETGGDPTPSLAYLRRNPGDSSGAILARIIRRDEGSLQPHSAWTSDIHPDRAVIDNSTYSYYIRGNLRGGEPLAFLSAFVRYEMP